MSLESKIETLTNTLVAVNNTLTTLMAQLQAAPVAAPQAAQAVVPQQPATIAPLTPVPAPLPMATPEAAPVQMPPTPSFMAPPAAAPVAVPFTDTKGLITYMTQAYGALGPEKGAQMQNVLTNFGYGNVNDVKPEHFPAVFQAIEALKAQ